MTSELTYDTLVNDPNYIGDRARIENQVILDELERKKRARTIAVPTDDNRVKARLREIGEPITLFGERPADRRDRLIYVLSQINAARGDEGMNVDGEDSDDDSDEEEESEFYTPGSLELLQARRRIAEYSLPRAQKRIAQQIIDSRMELGKVVDIRKKVFAEVKKFSILGSQIGDERPISQVRFSPNNEILVTGSWSGTVKLWNVPSCTPIRSLRGHSDRVGGVAWHPQATLSQSPDAVNLVSGAADCKLHLWSLNSDTPLSTLKGHQDRVCRVAFHPSGSYVASASYDTTWRLWDVNTSQELLLQEGHSEGVYAVEFQGDGALVASGGLDAIGRVWDLRTGRTAMVLDGHVQGIYSIGFSPNGYQLATGAGDDTIRIWDIRNLRSLYTIPGHTSNVSDVRFFYGNVDVGTNAEGDVEMPEAEADAVPSPSHTPITSQQPPTSSSSPNPNPTSAPASDPPTFTSHELRTYRSGLFFVSSGYDGYVKIWSADDWQMIRTLSADGGKVMSVDVTSGFSGSGSKGYGGTMIASGTYNRNFQLFSCEE
ncbi:U4/U6 snRNP-specific spliceosomal protein [Gymnopus androsaceus JB14]|uniref:U4/U6 snRNP-specific spliceosomal protein n=1 Tax=Gymnopus androsaceus JB14 TaxID=1447944 RepID=A0A6A4GTW3_9AGAR|nr:U4/U6 snRNP-specific spliceosomal protein [Gymnopus androsaceus JB14]